MSIITMMNLKGGVAKTATTVALAESFAHRCRRTLVIDGDHQCMSSLLLLGEPEQERCEKSHRNLSDLFNEMLRERFGPRSVERRLGRVAGVENLHVLAGSLQIDDFAYKYEQAIRNHRDRDALNDYWNNNLRRLKAYLKSRFDVVLVDCPPTLSYSTKCLNRIADGFVVPCVPDRLSIRGSRILMERMRRRGVGTAPLGTVWTLYRENNSIHREMVRVKRPSAIPVPFRTVIPNATEIARALDWDRSPARVPRKYGKFGRLFVELTHEIEDRLESGPQSRAA